MNNIKKTYIVFVNNIEREVEATSADDAIAQVYEDIGYDPGEVSCEEDDALGICQTCSGSGEGMHDGTTCPVCHGRGES